MYANNKLDYQGVFQLKHKGIFFTTFINTLRLDNYMLEQF